MGAEGEREISLILVLKLSGKRTAGSNFPGETLARGHRRSKFADKDASNLSGKRTGGAI